MSHVHENDLYAGCDRDDVSVSPRGAVVVGEDTSDRIVREERVSEEGMTGVRVWKRRPQCDCWGMGRKRYIAVVGMGGGAGGIRCARHFHLIQRRGRGLKVVVT